MLNRLLAAAALLSLAACGDGGGETTDRAPGFKSGERLMISLTGTTFTLGETCTNATDWVASANALAEQLSPGNVAYEINGSVDEADLLTCTSPGVITSCTKRNPRVVLAIEEGVLVNRFQESAQPAGTTCSIIYSSTARTEDHGTTFTETLVQEISLDGDPDACAELDASFATASDNGLGIDGCIMTFVTTGALK